MDFRNGKHKHPTHLRTITSTVRSPLKDFIRDSCRREKSNVLTPAKSLIENNNHEIAAPAYHLMAMQIHSKLHCFFKLMHENHALPKWIPRKTPNPKIPGAANEGKTQQAHQEKQ